jgi:hypothetical protein
VSWGSASHEIPTGSGPSVGRGTRGRDVRVEDRCSSSGKSRELCEQEVEKSVEKIPIQSEPSICGTGGNHREPSAVGPIRKSGIPGT